MERRKNKRLFVESEKPDNDDKFIEQIDKISKNLFYPSETDAEIHPFVGGKSEAVTEKEILSQIGMSEETPIEERDFSEFFSRLTEIQDWFGFEEKEIVWKFTKLKDFLEKNLKDLKIFKVGKIELDIYVVGLNAENKLMGIQTKSVET